MKPVSIGIIGEGNIGRVYLKGSRFNEWARIFAAADPFAQSQAEFAKLNTDPRTFYYDDYRSILNHPEIEAVVIATPDYTHAKIACEALDAGKHVLSEKPAAVSLDELEELTRAVRVSDRIYQIGLECRFIPVFREMKRMIDEGKVGSPRMLWCHEFRGPFLKKVDDWIWFQDKTGGAFNEKTCHYFDLFNWFTGALPSQVIALGGQDVIKEIQGVKPDVIDNGWVMVEYKNKVRASLGLCMFAENGPEGYFSDITLGCMGDAGRMEGRFKRHDIDLWQFQPASHTLTDAGTGKPDESLSFEGAGIFHSLRSFCRSIREGAPVQNDIEAARQASLIGLAAEASLRDNGKPVRL